MKNTNIQLLPSTIKTLQDFIKDNLTKRCINVPIKLDYSVETGRFDIISEKFNTVPVIFKELELMVWSSSISDEQTNDSLRKYREVFINVHVKMSSFYLGRNAEKLFHIECKIFDNTIVGLKCV